MIPNGEKREAKPKGRKDKFEGRRWNYLPVKKTINIIKRNNIKK